MHDATLLRYSRQILLPEIGAEGQQRLINSRVLIIGLGGLGSPVAMYLAAAGIGELILADDDVVDLSNLQRQIVHLTGNIGQAKVLSAQQHLQQLNPDCQVTPYPKRLDAQALQQVVANVNLVVDCSDNFPTRFLLNQVCHTYQTPLVSGAAIRWEGQVSVFNYQPGTACYRCLYAEHGEEEQNCTGNGIIAPLVGVIGSLQALEAIKILAAAGATLQDRLLVFDALSHTWRSIQLRPDPNCPVCGKHI